MARRSRTFRPDPHEEERRRLRARRDGVTIPSGSAPSLAGRLIALGLVPASKDGTRYQSREGLDVEVMLVCEHPTRCAITVRHPAMSPKLSIGAETTGSRLGKWVSGEDVQTGDPDFDAAVLLRGDEAECLARLTHQARGEVTALLNGGDVRDGMVRWARAAKVPLPDIDNRVARLMWLARALGGPVDIDVRLLQTARADPLPGVRRRALAMYLARGGEIGGVARRRLLADDDAWVRLLAAKAADDQTTLIALAVDAKTPAEVRAVALERLLSAPPDALLSIFDRAAATDVPRPIVLRGLLAALGGTATRAGELGEASALCLLAEGPPELREAMIERLAEVGTEASVATLAELADAFFGRREHKERARNAIHRIAQRQGGLRQGGLSIVDADGGLALIDDEKD
ncbi:MAG: hypothetical protein KC620_25290 [Myxococcales bacterium]|nr:hypothetical protein [Myxococcales bacterium]